MHVEDFGDAVSDVVPGADALKGGEQGVGISLGGQGDGHGHGGRHGFTGIL